MDPPKILKTITRYQNSLLQHNFQLQSTSNWASIKLNTGAKYLGVFSLLVPSKWDKNTLVLPRCISFKGSVFNFQFFNNQIHNYVFFDIIVNLIIQKLNSKHTSLQTYPVVHVARVMEQCCFNSTPEWLFKYKFLIQLLLVVLK